MFPFRSSIFVVLIAIACTMATPVLSYASGSASTDEINLKGDKSYDARMDPPGDDARMDPPEENTSFIGRVWNGFWRFFTNQGSLFVKENIKEFRTELSKEFGKGLGSDLGKKTSGGIGGFFTGIKTNIAKKYYSLKGIEAFKNYYNLIRILPENTSPNTARRIKAEIKRNKFIYRNHKPTIDEKATELIYPERTMINVQAMMTSIIKGLTSDSKNSHSLKQLMPHILFGDPGTGKTELAERIINMIPSSSINNILMYKTTGSAILKWSPYVFKQLLFTMKQSKKKIILLIDEIDPIFEAVNNRGTYSRKEMEDTLLDMFGQPSEQYVIIGTTNKPYIEQPRIRQRFQLHHIKLPDYKARIKFFQQMYYKGMSSSNCIFPDFELFDTFTSLLLKKYSIEEIRDQIKDVDNYYTIDVLTTLLRDKSNNEDNQDIQEKKFSIIDISEELAGRDFLKLGQDFLGRLSTDLDDKIDKANTTSDLDSIKLTGEDLSYKYIVLDVLDTAFMDQKIATYKQDENLKIEKINQKNKEAAEAALNQSEKREEILKNIKKLEENLKEAEKSDNLDKIQKLRNAIDYWKNQIDNE